jgi:hypothetical protein
MTTGRNIFDENKLPGTLDWQLQWTRFDPVQALAASPLVRNLRSSTAEGFGSKTSVYPGESLDFCVSLDPAGEVTFDFYRLGYYDGLGGRHVKTIGPFEGEPQPVPMMTTERLRECDWARTVTFEVPEDWVSGVYLAKLTRDQEPGFQSYIVFVVKSREPSDLLVQVSDITWQAYNKWPANDSIYDDGSGPVWYSGPNVRVSFNRPYAKYCQILDAPLSVGSGEFLLWEHPLAFWLEAEGYDVAYCSNLDLHNDPEVLDRATTFLSVAHDEYWSRPMYDAVMTARDAGMSLAFLSGNAVYHEIQFYDSEIDGTPCRSFARKQRFTDEDLLMGTKSYGSAAGDWLVTKPDHWIYAETGLTEGDRIPGLIGWEYHGTPADIPGLEVVAASELFPRSHRSNPKQDHAAVVFPCEKGNWVFNAGTIWWSEGLSQPPGHIPARTGRSGPQGVSAQVQQITRNVLNRMIEDSPRKQLENK